MNMELGEGRIGRFSLQVRRLFVGLAALPCALSVADWYFKWNLFGRFGRYSVGVSFIVLFLVMRYLGPTTQEMRDYRDSKRHE
jgi:hypothetical protein